MTVKITHPEASFTGNAINLDFTGGVAEVKSLSKEARTVLSEHGFTVKSVEPTAAEKAAAEKAKADAAQRKADEEAEAAKVEAARVEAERVATEAKAVADKATADAAKK